MFYPHKIYLSGVDCAGKSTLAEQMSKALNYKIFKWTVPLPNEDYHEKARQHATLNESIILDRGWAGDSIYAPIFGAKPVMSEEDAIELLMQWTRLGNTLIWVDADEGALQRRLALRGDAHINALQLAEAHNAYKEFFKKVHAKGIPFYIIDTTNL